MEWNGTAETRIGEGHSVSFQDQVKVRFYTNSLTL